MVTEHSGRTTAYCHDELYRLKAETVFDTATTLTEGCLTPAQRTGASYTADYQYGWTGNRTYETVDGVQTAYSYDYNDRLLQTGGTVYGYDANGNTISKTLDGDTTIYQYNGKNQLTQTSKAGITSTYTYNPNGIRNGKTEGGVTTRFIVDENRDYAQVLEEITNGTITTTYSYGHDLISQDKNGMTSFYHYDGLGSTRALSDALGTFTDTYDYEAFGEVLSQTGDTENNYLFTGEQFDAGLNQYYLRARYYNQQIGRFTQMDTWAGNNQDPITLHKYLGMNVDPVNYTDPTGNFGLGSFSASFNIQAAFATAAITAVGLSSIDFSMSASPVESIAGATYGILWNMVATMHFKSKTHGDVSSTTTSQASLRQRSSNDGHHTIPIYLCGAREQQLSFIDRRQHIALHSGLALIEVAKYSAEEAADAIIPLAARRTDSVMDLAGSKAGRRVIAGAIQGYYQLAGWWEQGAPTIGTIFPYEKEQYVGGHTSLPACSRAR